MSDDGDTFPEFYQNATINKTGNGIDDIFSIGWNLFDSHYLRHNTFWTVTIILAYTAIFVIGFFGNLIVIMVFILRPQLRTVTNMFIVNLAAADLIAVSFCFLGNLLSNIFTPWILGRLMCKAVVYLQGVSVCASSYTLAAISVHRCKAVYRPFASSRGLSKSQAFKTIIVIWIFSLVIISPWSVTFKIVHVDGRSLCQEIWGSDAHGKVFFLLVNFLLCFVFPLVLIVFTNTMIWYRVGYQKLSKDGTGEVNPTSQHTVPKKVRYMLGIITVSFALCWFPLYIMVIRYRFASNVGKMETNMMHVMLPFAQWLGSSNSSVNPVLYAFLDRKFWEMFKSLRICQNVFNRGN